MKIVDGKKIAQSIKEDIKKEISDLKSKYNVIPKIFTIVTGDNPESRLYLKLREKACEEVGIDTDHIILSESTDEKEILKEIEKLNKDEKVHGIIVQFPLPKNVSQNKIMGAIDPKKDVEGVNPINLGRTLVGIEDIVPCTPLAVLTILKHENISLEGRDIVIINHSNIVGKPLAAMLLNRNATVTICQIYTKNLKRYNIKEDVLRAATGKPGLIKKDFVKENAVLIDVGITRVGDTVKGDIDFESVKEKAAIVTPVPGGVGPVTIACSLKNMLKVFKKQYIKL
jgi:methylenetetrahydrofolate dehydrogenase (NADP+)/methenyltetrahydrofolate cyclohydrolase